MCSWVLSWWRTTPSLRRLGCFLLAYCKLFSTRHIGLTGCPCSRQSTCNTTHESRKMMVSTFPANHFTLNLCFLVQLGCIHARVHHLLVGMNGRSIIITSNNSTQTAVSLYCITFQENEIGHHSCCFVIY